MHCQHTLKIIYEDEALLVIDKPAWQLSVPGKKPELISSVQHAADYLQQPAYVVHRLDCATSGVMIFAKTLQAQRHLHKSFRDRKVSKLYQALLCAMPASCQGIVDLPLITDWPARPKQKIDYESGKAAQTCWSIAGQQTIQQQEFTLVNLRPITGRTHQLRVHMAACGHAILGDRLYAPVAFHSQPDGTAPFSRLYLHAYKIYLQHPLTRKSVSFHSTPVFDKDAIYNS